MFRAQNKKGELFNYRKIKKRLNHKKDKNISTLKHFPGLVTREINALGMQQK